MHLKLLSLGTGGLGFYYLREQSNFHSSNKLEKNVVYWVMNQDRGYHINSSRPGCITSQVGFLRFLRNLNPKYAL